MFKQKSDADLANLNEAELAKYFRDFMEHKEKALKNAISEEMHDSISKLKAEIAEISDKRTETITKALEAQGVAIQKMSMNSEATKTDNRYPTVAPHIAALKVLKDDNTKGWVKVEKTMTLSGNATGYGLPYNDPTVYRIAERKPFIQSLLNARTLSATNTVLINVQKDRVGDAGVTAEGAAKNSMEFDIEAQLVLAKKITAVTKTSREFIDDIPFMESLIRDDLSRRVALAADAQILTGSGSGANLTGIFTTATAFSAGIHALSVVEANRYDVLAIAIAQVMKNNFMPNYIVLNPDDVASMDVTKDSTGQYALPAFVSPDGTRIKSIPVIVNNGITAGQYMVMDSTMADVYTRESMTVSIGYENDDFTKNLVTLIGEWRGLCVVSPTNVGAFVKGVFATNIAAILKP